MNIKCAVICIYLKKTLAKGVCKVLVILKNFHFLKLK